MTTADRDYLPDAIAILLLKCHRCFSMVEVDDPTAGLIYICGMCHSDLEIADTGRGVTRPPTATVIGVPVSSATPHPTTTPLRPANGTTVITGRFAASATLFRKGTATPPTQGSGAFRFTPPAGHPLIPRPDGRPGRSRLDMELEPTTARQPRSIAAGRMFRVLQTITHPWIVVAIGTATIVTLIALWLAARS